MVIIYGYSKLAAKIAKELQNDKKEIIIVEPNQKYFDMAKADNYGDKYFQLECYDDDDLLKIGIQNERLFTFYSLHSEFNKNLFVTLSARTLRNDLKIISMANSENEAKKLNLAGASKILNPYELVALKMFRYLHRPMALKIIDDILYSNSSVAIEEILVHQNSKLNGEYLSNITAFDEHNLIVLGLQDTEITHDFIFASRGINHKIDAGDTIVVLGEKENINNFRDCIEEK